MDNQVEDKFVVGQLVLANEPIDDEWYWPAIVESIDAVGGKSTSKSRRSDGKIRVQFLGFSNSFSNLDVEFIQKYDLEKARSLQQRYNTCKYNEAVAAAESYRKEKEPKSNGAKPSRCQQPDVFVNAHLNKVKMESDFVVKKEEEKDGKDQSKFKDVGQGKRKKKTGHTKKSKTTRDNSCSDVHNSSKTNGKASSSSSSFNQRKEVLEINEIVIKEEPLDEENLNSNEDSASELLGSSSTNIENETATSENPEDTEDTSGNNKNNNKSSTSTKNLTKAFKSISKKPTSQLSVNSGSKSRTNATKSKNIPKNSTSRTSTRRTNFSKPKKSLKRKRATTNSEASEEEEEVEENTFEEDDNMDTENDENDVLPDPRLKQKKKGRPATLAPPSGIKAPQKADVESEEYKEKYRKKADLQQQALQRKVDQFREGQYDVNFLLRILGTACKNSYVKYTKDKDPILNIFDHCAKVYQYWRDPEYGYTKFTSYVDVEDHLDFIPENQKSPRRYCCPIPGCPDQKPRLLNRYRLHLQTHTLLVSSFTCPLPECEETFEEQNLLKNHLKDHDLEAETLWEERKAVAAENPEDFNEPKPKIIESLNRELSSAKFGRVVTSLSHASLPSKGEINACFGPPKIIDFQKL